MSLFKETNWKRPVLSEDKIELLEQVERHIFSKGVLKERLTLESGLSMSIQFGAGHRCSPRVNGLHLWEHTTVEIGMPSREIPEIERFQEPDEWDMETDEMVCGDPTEGVFNFVPIGTLIQIIRDNGGVKQVMEVVK